MGPLCGSCGAVSSPRAKFCSECGTPLSKATPAAEYKQVTVLFADVVHSMEIAAAVGIDRSCANGPVILNSCKTHQGALCSIITGGAECSRTNRRFKE